MRLLTAIFFLVVIVCNLKLEAQHPVWHNYNAHHGLAGNEVYKMLSAQNGYMWFVADQGICRFNGYEFIRPVDTSAMRGTEAYVPAEDAMGRIWFARLDGSVWFIENDTIRAWEYNHVLRPFLEKHTPIESISIDDEEAMWLAIQGLGFLVVNLGGTYQVTPSPMESALVFVDVGGKLIFTRQYDGLANSPIYRVPVISLITKYRSQLTCFFQHHNERGIWNLLNGDLLLSCKDSTYLIRNEQIIWQASTDIEVDALIETPDGGLLLASHKGNKPGLFYFESIGHFQKGGGVNLLPGYFVTDVRYDREGGLWASTHHAGVWYCSNPGVVVYDQTVGLPSAEVTCLANDGISVVYAGLANGDVVAIDGNEDKVVVLPRPSLISKEVVAIHYNQDLKRLWCGQLLQYLDHNIWKPAIQLDPQGKVLAKSINESADKNTLWTSSPFGFFNVDARNNTGRILGQRGENKLLERTFSVASDQDDNVWVATLSGLRLWRNDAYEPPSWDHPALRYQARDLAILPNGGLAISLPGAGLLIRDGEGHFTHLTQNQGLNSDFLSKLYVSPEGDLFACSYNGLHRISSNGEGGWKIATMDVRKGLPSNHVKDVTSLQGELWVATDKGLARIGEMSDPTPMPVPILEEWLVNNEARTYTQNMRLSHSENNLRIRFYSLHFRSVGEIPYRYRLIGADTTFTYSQIREVNYARLSPGDYTFEVQAQNEDGVWSDPAKWSFQILPAWWNTYWFRGGMVLLLFMGAGFWNKWRLQEVRREAHVREKIRDLEAAALRAQMNPHFIFNCLGSIQNFIVENDTASATRYLASFARLVRLALHGSVDGRHTLKEEVDMLENYLTLEQLRFRTRFTYSIQVDPDLDPDDISLPPLLVQPFVENAILHGMKHKENDGKISIHFFQKDDYLNVEVTDNGPGLDPEVVNPVSIRKSVGMMLTERRLELLSGLSGTRPFLAENILGPTGMVEGARVSVRTPLNI